MKIPALLGGLICTGIVNGDCEWNVNQYGFVDLRPLKGLQIEVVREEKNQYSLLYTPCNNNLFCDRDVYDDKNGMALQVMTNDLPDINCNGIISAWDSHTHPRHETNEDDEDVLVFSYPVFPPQTSGDGCFGGRSGEFTFICDENAIPYEPGDFYQNQIDENGVCAYFATIRSAYACATDPQVISSNNGLSGGWIFCIAFMCFVAFYCIAGCLINGYKRKEWKDVQANIPHFYFWAHVPKLVKTGCCVSKEYLFGVIGRKQYDGDTENLYDEVDEEQN
eukprot:308632_1